jgi:hypothetical protein
MNAPQNEQNMPAMKTAANRLDAIRHEDGRRRRLEKTKERTISVLQ